MTKEMLAALSLLGPTYALTAYAEVYMSDEQAANLIFAGEKMQKSTVTLTDEEKQKIEDESKQTVRSKELTILKSAKGSVIFVDQVLGKHEFITYATGITKDGKVKGIEILEYRESYGHQIRRESWRQQFVGKTSAAPLQLDHDIKNISGATLSTSHVASGVKRLLVTYDTIKSRL